MEEVGSFEDVGFIEHLGLDGVWSQFNVETPLLHLFALGYHAVEFTDGVDSVLRFLKQTLAHLSHGLFILAYFLWNSDQHAEFRGQVDVLALLLDLEKRLVEAHDLFVVLLFEVDDHRNGGSVVALFKLAGFGAHVPTDSAHLVRFVVAVAGHHDRTFEFVVDRLLDFVVFGLLTSIAESFVAETHHLVVDELEAIFNRKVLRDVVDDQVQPLLENPRRREEPRPRLDSVVERLGL